MTNITLKVNQLDSIGKKILRNARFPMLAPAITDSHSVQSGCAWFVQQALIEAGCPLALQSGFDTRDLRRALLLSSQWKLVYRHGTDLGVFKAQAGDVAIWDKSTRAQDETGRCQLVQNVACGVLDGRGRVVHPGQKAHVAGMTEMRAICADPSFGQPTAVYRRIEMMDLAQAA